MKKTPQLEYHTVANAMPLMTDIEFDNLKNDISGNGLREPIVLYQNKIIDGRNRYRACLETNTTPLFKEYNGNEADLLDYVISLDISRRHLSKSEVGCLAVDNIEYYEINQTR